MKLFLALLYVALSALPAFAGWVILENQPPYPSGTAPSSFTWRSGCVKSGQYERAAVTSPSAVFKLEGLPDAGRCWFVSEPMGATAARSNEVAFDFTGNEAVPLKPAAAPAITWAAVPPVDAVATFALTSVNEAYRLTITNKSPTPIVSVRATLAPAAATFDNATPSPSSTITPTLGINNDTRRANVMTITPAAPLAAGASVVVTGDIDGGTTGAALRVNFSNGQAVDLQVKP